MFASDQQVRKRTTKRAVAAEVRATQATCLSRLKNARDGTTARNANPTRED
jgi:hypothetical protein